MTAVLGGIRSIGANTEAEEISTHEIRPFMKLAKGAVIRRAEDQSTNRIAVPVSTLQ